MYFRTKLIQCWCPRLPGDPASLQETSPHQRRLESPPSLQANEIGPQLPETSRRCSRDFQANWLSPLETSLRRRLGESASHFFVSRVARVAATDQSRRRLHQWDRPLTYEIMNRFQSFMVCNSATVLVMVFAGQSSKVTAHYKCKMAPLCMQKYGFWNTRFADYRFGCRPFKKNVSSLAQTWGTIQPTRFLRLLILQQSNFPGPKGRNSMYIMV